MFEVKWNIKLGFKEETFLLSVYLFKKKNGEMFLLDENHFQFLDIFSIERVIAIYDGEIGTCLQGLS